jgi:hypothetical protein
LSAIESNFCLVIVEVRVSFHKTSLVYNLNITQDWFLGNPKSWDVGLPV